MATVDPLEVPFTDPVIDESDVDERRTEWTRGLSQWCQEQRRTFSPPGASRTASTTTTPSSSSSSPNAMERPFFLTIAGLIGAGKSTLAAELSTAFDLQLYLEDVEGNVYLEDFYSDMAKYSFQLQIYLLNRRFRQHQEISWNKKGGIQDRTVYEDPIFAKVLLRLGLMTQRDFDTYLELFQNMSKFMDKPQVIVYLDVEPEVALFRIKKRNRPSEKGITLEYLTMLRNAYEEFVAEASSTVRIIRVNWNECRDCKLTAFKIQEECRSPIVARSLVF